VRRLRPAFRRGVNRRLVSQDACGNNLQLWEHSVAAGAEEVLPLRSRFEDRSESTVLPYTLWPGETAWKLRAVCAPRADAEFNSDELCVFRGVPVPDHDRVIPFLVSGGAMVGDKENVLLGGCGVSCMMRSCNKPYPI
jgi:hypothetical protein